MGLVSDGGVHSRLDHIRALVELAAREGVRDLVVHAFTDGRDTLPTSGAGLLAELEGWLAERGGRDRHRQRPLLRDGPRPPLGAHPARLRRDRHGRGRPPASAVEAVAPPTAPASPTSSSSRS